MHDSTFGFSLFLSFLNKISEESENYSKHYKLGVFYILSIRKMKSNSSHEFDSWADPLINDFWKTFKCKGFQN